MAQANQELQQLYSELINRMKQGVEMHEQLADYYNFLNLPGYQKCHEYQMLCELLTYRKAKDMYMKEYNQLVQPNYLSGLLNMGNNMSNNNNNSQNGVNYAENVIPQNWYKYTRYDVDQGTKRNGVKEGFKKWLDYERDTKQFLTQMSDKLNQIGEREAARRLDYLIDHVEKEIEQAEEKMISLESSGYDMNYILSQQEELKEKYAEKIRNINMKDFQHRMRGNGNYANYNLSEDDEDDFYYRRMRGRLYDDYGRRYY